MASCVLMASSPQPVIFYVPNRSDEPIAINVTHSGLRMVLVHREAVRRLGDEWRVLGLYFLLGPDPNAPDRYLAYIGEVGKRNLLLRVTEHAAQKDWWNRALLVASDSTAGFNSAEIGWLEGRFYDVLNNAVAATVKNKGRPGDDSILPLDRAVLEKYVEPTIAALRAVGAPPDTADQKPIPKHQKRARYDGSVGELVANGLLKAGTLLTPLRGHLEDTALVLPNGRLEVKGVGYDSPSGAAAAVTGNKAEAGWDFWGAPSGDGRFVALHELRLRLKSLPAAEPVQAESGGSSTPVERPSKAAAKLRYGVALTDLLAAGLLNTGQSVRSVRTGSNDVGTITADGRIRVGDSEFSSPSAAAKAVTGHIAEPGWDFWAIDDGDITKTLHQVRKTFLENKPTPSHHDDGEGTIIS